jgi:hypothetical protein
MAGVSALCSGAFLRRPRAWSRGTGGRPAQANA